MTLLKLDIFSLRNIQNASINPAERFNLIIGNNASGKTSLLEAIFILGRARSHRTNQSKQAISFDQPQLIVSAQSRPHHGGLCYLGIQIDNKQQTLRINQENVQKADLAYALPVLMIHPKSYRLLDGGPQYRREFLDWGVFNQSQAFLMAWRQYSKALQQRNALLKTRQLQQLSIWDKAMTKHGFDVSELRKIYVDALQPLFIELANHFVGVDSVELRYQQGWDADKELGECLRRDLDKDFRYGFTHSGPHRADFQVFHNRKLAKDFMSRGQQKLLVLALILAQVKLLNRQTDNRCCILIDDLTSELDTENRAKLLKCLAELDCQVFMTSTELSEFGDLSALKNYKVFHVEQGRITQV